MRGTPVAEPAPVGVAPHEAEGRRVVGVDDLDDRDAPARVRVTFETG